MPTLFDYRRWTILIDKSVSSSGEVQVGQSTLSISNPNGFGAENPFDMYRYMYSGGSVGSVVHTGKQYEFEGSSDFGSSASFGLGPDTWLDDASLWSRTNPSRPAVLLPVFWLELKDIPDMIRQAGRFLLAGKNWRRSIRQRNANRDLATANLAFQFGWVPLLGDLYKLNNFMAVCEKRRRSIEKAKQKGGYRFKIGLGSETGEVGVFSGYVNFGSLNFNPIRKGRYTTTRWAVMKWMPQPGQVEIPTRDEDLTPHLLGLTAGSITSNVWEALPWSWLVDYFANIGEVLNAGNHGLAYPAGGSQMRKTSISIEHGPASDWRWDYTKSDWTEFRLLPGQINAVRKSRRPATAGGSIIASIPNLGAGQLSILASLAYLKR